MDENVHRSNTINPFQPQGPMGNTCWDIFHYILPLRTTKPIGKSTIHECMMGKWHWKSSEDQVLEICWKKPATYRTNPMYNEINHLATRWWFQIFFIFTPSWGRFPFWLVFFRWVETTNQSNLCRISSINSMICMIPTNLPFYLSITPMFGRVSVYVKGWTSENGSVMFFYFRPDLWGFMIQFEEHIFQLGWLKLPRKPKYVSRCIVVESRMYPREV